MLRRNPAKATSLSGPLALAILVLVSLPFVGCTPTTDKSTAIVSSRAYSGHEGNADANNFVNMYPSKIGTRLDDCQLCHIDGTVANAAGTKTNYYNSCGFCHLITFQDSTYTVGAPASYIATLNSYGLAYKNAGRNMTAIGAIAGIDSDSDTYSNLDEIAADRFPGNPLSYPGLPVAPTITLTMAKVKAMTQHPEFLLMNASKQQYDSYATYKGPTMKDLLTAAEVNLTGATGIVVFAPDGYQTAFTISAINNTGNSYYPTATYYWVDQSAMPTQNCFVTYPSPIPINPATGSAYVNLDPISDLQLIVAYERDGSALDTSYLDSTTRLQGEGPFRVVPPQSKTPTKPDRGSGFVTSPNPVGDGRDYTSTLDHNAGNSPRGAVLIKILPMPTGYEEPDHTNNWTLLTAGKIMIYGNGVQ